jgi:hypothetical protein
MLYIAVPLKVILAHYVMKAKREVNIQIHVFLTLTLTGGVCSTSCSGRFNPRTQWIGVWVEPKADLDDLQRR